MAYNMDQLLESYFLVKRDLRELEYQEGYLKDQISGYMDDNGTNKIRTPTFEVNRSFVNRQVMKKSNVPDDVWDAYASNVFYPTLRLKPL